MDTNRPNCPHCGIPMSILRYRLIGERKDSIVYQCPWHGQYRLGVDGRLAHQPPFQESLSEEQPPIER
jgi:hypothetical protein